MAEQTLKAMLETLTSQQDAQIEHLKKELASNRNNQKEIAKQIEALTVTGSQLKNDAEQISNQLRKMESLRVQPQLEATLEALSNSYLELLSYVKLSDERHSNEKAFLKAHPQITPNLLAEYEKFESDPQTALQALPESYQQSVLRIHQERKNMLAPYFELQRQIQQIEEETQLTLQLILVQVKENDFNWIVPIPYDPQDLSDSIEDRLDDVLQELLNAILKLAQHKDWIFGGIEEENEPWLGYWTMTTLMEYSGTLPKAEHAQTLLREVFTVLPINIEVTEISSVIWDAGRKFQSNRAKAQSAKPTKVITPRVPLVESTGGWYRDEDIVSWERPLNVNQESRWNAQGRRLRTALTNMVMKGFIDVPAVPVKQLWQHLPEPHQSDMKKGVMRLLENQVLIADGDKVDVERSNVAVNSKKIQQVQSLINREIDDFWQPLITVM